MNWLQRYVEAVQRYLPKSMRTDVGEELLSVLESKVEEAEEAKSRPLTDPEILAILKNFGHPLQVASGYDESRALVSASLLPIYKQVLKYMLLGFFTVSVGARIIAVSGLVDPWPRDLNSFIELYGLWSIVLVTTAFYLSDSYLARLDIFSRWNPENLPPAGRGKPVSVPQSMFNIVVGLIVFANLSAVDSTVSREAWLGSASDPWESVILWSRALVLMGMIGHLVTLFRPYWSRRRLIFRTFTDLCMSAIAGWALITIKMGILGNSILWTFLLVGLVGAGSSLYKAFAGPGPKGDVPTTWLDRKLEKDIQRSLPRNVGKSFKA